MNGQVPAMEARGRAVTILLVVLVIGSGVILAVDPASSGGPAGDSFQLLVGGFGGGPAVGPGGCEFALDPRHENSCSASLGPVPGGGCFCGRHTGLLSHPPRGGGGGYPLPD